ncbi:MAG: FAD-dependent oxidoreductase [archaeon]
MKVAVIGCGITGAYLGWKLAESGHDVTIFEKKQIIGKEVCSGLVSERIWDFLPKDETLVEHRINSTNIHFPGKTCSLKFKQRMLVLNHAKLDRYVSELARKAGAKIIVNKFVVSMPEGFDRMICADGALSPTRKLMGLKEPKFRQGLQFFVNEKNTDDFVDTWPVKNGFIWKIPRSECVEYGIMSDVRTARVKLNEFCQKNGIAIPELQAALIPRGLAVSNKKDVALCGDAAGLTKPWSGGGVIWSLTAADILLKHFPDFDRYNKELRRFFGWTTKRTGMITRLGYFAGNNLPWILPSSREIDSDWL